MVNLGDILASVKARLRIDVENDPEIWSDNELIDYINLAYIALAGELRMFKKTLSFSLEKKLNFYPYPHDLLEPVAAYIDNKKIAVKSLNGYIESNEPRACFADDGVRVSENSGTFELIYNAFKRVNDLNDELYIKEFMIECVIYYVMHLAIQKQMRSDSINLSAHYKKLFEMELSKVRQINCALSESKDIRTKYVKV